MGSRSARALPTDTPSEAGDGEGDGDIPFDTRRSNAGGERHRRVDGDHQQRGADRVGHAEPQRQDESGDDDEATADAEEAGDEPNDAARGQNLGRDHGRHLQALRRRGGRRSSPGGRGRGFRVGHEVLVTGARLGLVHPHAPRGDEHQPGEGEQQDVRIHGVVQSRTEQSAADPGKTEDDARKDADMSGAQVGEHPAQRGGPDDDQRGGGGGLGTLAGRVDQDGDGEDRSAPAERAQ